MIRSLDTEFLFPDIAEIFLPPLNAGEQPPEAEFMALRLRDDCVGVSYVLVPEQWRAGYEALRADTTDLKSVTSLAVCFGSADPIENMLAMAALNAMCCHVMRTGRVAIDTATDSLGLLNINAEDHLGMVGFFKPLIERIEACGARLTIIELNDSYRQRYPYLHITTDTSELRSCNKVLCTGTTVYNDTLDAVLAHCSAEAFISVIGPTAGFLPDPLFARGVDVVGGTLIHDGTGFMRRLAAGDRWTDTRRKICFQRSTYTGLKTSYCIQSRRSMPLIS